MQKSLRIATFNLGGTKFYINIRVNNICSHWSSFLLQFRAEQRDVFCGKDRAVSVTRGYALIKTPMFWHDAALLIIYLHGCVWLYFISPDFPSLSAVTQDQ